VEVDVSWNFSAIVVGLPGYGKTTLQAQLIQRHFETTDGIVLAHDPVRQFAKLGCHVYPDAAAYRRAAAEAATKKTPMPRGASIGGTDSDSIVMLAMEMGEKLNTADRVRVPILVPFDEGSIREGSGSTYVSKLDNQLLATRRHLGVGLILNVQECAQLMNRWYLMSTDVYLFRQTSDRANLLDGYLALEKGTLARAGVTRLEQHRYLHVRCGVGVVSEAL
jgi:hypothetical protein